MAEGEQLSKKQLAQESTMKKLRQHVKDAELSRNELAADLAVERQKVEAATAARQKAEGELAAAKSAHRQELEADRAHYNGLLAKSRAAQVGNSLRLVFCTGHGLTELFSGRVKLYCHRHRECSPPMHKPFQHPYFP